MKSVFPKDFLWGASTASHQVEGNTHNQWSVFELETANEAAKHAERYLSFMPAWEDVKDQAQDPSNYVSGEGVDHYQRYEQDFDLLKKLNLNAFRFGIEWSRIEPREGHWDEREIEHYRSYITALLDRGITPVLNLWHWTVPVWFDAKGGFTKRSNVKYFKRFVKKLSESLDFDELTYIITINEANTYTYNSYNIGLWPPQLHSSFTTLWGMYNLVKAHKVAYKVLKKQHPHLQIGSATQLDMNKPLRPGNWLDEIAMRIMDIVSVYWFLQRTKYKQDFVGFNFYHTNYYKGFKKTFPNTPLSDVGWYMEPGSIYDLLKKLGKRYKLPIIIAENGLADRHDTVRKWWLQENMTALTKARQEGIPVIGYFHWSLMDNFEWSLGWWPQFGLIHVDRQDDYKRTIRASAKWWSAELAKLQKEP